jgi:hypothetical protein
MFTVSFVAVIDAIPFGDRPVAICVLVSDTRCAVRGSGDGEPLTGVGSWIVSPSRISASGTCSVACSELIIPPGIVAVLWLARPGDHL